MNALYAETSAVLRWLLNDQDADVVRKLLDAGEAVVTSVLTDTEVQRAMIRARRERLITEAEARRLVGDYRSASRSWSFLEITATIRERAAAEFPVEPVRTLDAIHLASALELLAAYPDLRVLSFDRRIVENLEPLGLTRASAP